MKLISINIPERDLEFLKNLVDKHHFPNRSEAIRTAIRDLVRKEGYNIGFTIEEQIRKDSENHNHDYKKELEKMRQEQKILKEQQKKLKKTLSTMNASNNGYKALNPLIMNGLAKENMDLKKEIIISLLKESKRAMKTKKISELTGFNIDTVIDIISLYPESFRTTNNGEIILK